MSFAGKNLTQGGQMTAYRWRMFLQVNNWIGFWIFILFAVLASAIFLWRIPQETLDNGSLWWFAWMNSSFFELMPASAPKLYDIHYWYAPTQTAMVLKMTLVQIFTDPYMTAMGEQFLDYLQWAGLGSGVFSLAVFMAVSWSSNSISGFDHSSSVIPLSYTSSSLTHSDYNSGITINPSTGMPMVGGISGLDIHGNSFGTNFNEPSSTYDPNRGY